MNVHTLHPVKFAQRLQHASGESACRRVVGARSWPLKSVLLSVEHWAVVSVRHPAAARHRSRTYPARRMRMGRVMS
jgi:hypothetical protein